MEITKIEQQLKNTERYNLYIDGEFLLGVYDETLLKFQLRKGDEITAEKLAEIRDYDEFNYGKNVAYKFLSYKPRSIKEVKNKLTYKKISKASVEKIIEHLKKYDFVNDEVYAKMYLNEKIAKKGMGKSMIQFKMIDKGIDKEMISKVIDENYPEDKQVESGRKLLEKYLKKKSKIEDKLELKKKCYQYLFSRGYSYPVISKILDISEQEEKAE
jgi:regulatory protein